MPIRIMKRQPHMGDNSSLPIFEPDVVKEVQSKKTHRLQLAYEQQVNACDDCPLGSCKSVKKRPTWQGVIPCEILCIVEAPGDLENQYGFPLLGMNKSCLEEIMNQAVEQVNAKRRTPVRIAYIPTVHCMPVDTKSNVQKGTRPPKASEAKACVARNVNYFIREIAKPSLVIFVGRVAESYIPQYPDTLYTYIPHPGYILGKAADPRGEKLKAYTAIVDLIDKGGLVFG
jgi:uracil-DNA glycosylase family 4